MSTTIKAADQDFLGAPPPPDWDRLIQMLSDTHDYMDYYWDWEPIIPVAGSLAAAGEVLRVALDGGDRYDCALAFIACIADCALWQHGECARPEVAARLAQIADAANGLRC